MSNTGHGFVGAAVAAALNGGPLTIWGDGSTVRDFIAVQDVARAFEAAIAYDGSCTEFNIGTGHGTSLNETVLAVERAFSASVNVRRAEARSVDVPYSVLDISLAKDHLHWKPELTLDSALQMWGSEVGS